MARVLSAAHKEKYCRDGIVFPVPVLSEDEACRYRKACDDLEQHFGGKPRTIEVRQMHLHFPFAWQLASHPRVLDAVEDLLGPNLLVWATELFAKHPHDGAISIGWHRDRPYMGLTTRECATAWIALSECTPENGCMRAIPGPDHATAELDEANSIEVRLQPGEMSLHDPDILHGSSANRSSVKRVGFAIRFITPAAQPAHGRPPVVRARGSGACDQFELVDPPTEAETPKAVAAMKRSAAQHLDTILANLGHQNG